MPIRALFAACMITTAARAEFVDVPQVDAYSSLSKQMEEVSLSLGLGEDDGHTAKIVAAQWVYLGPCKGSQNDIPEAHPAVFNIVLDAKPDNRFGSAVLQMIAIINRNNLGRPHEDKCSFARAMANAE